MYEPDPGQLKTLNGVTKLNANPLLGINKIIHTKFLDTKSEKGLVVFYEPDTTLPSAPSGFTFSTSGGGAVTRDVYIEFLTIGNGKISTIYAAQSIQANGLTVTIPIGISDRVSSINVYVKAADGTIVWSGSAWRETSNYFPATMVVFPPGATQTSTLLSVGIPPGLFSGSASYDASGKLDSDRIYYLGLGPWFPSALSTGGTFSGLGYAECAFKTGSNNNSGATAAPTPFSVYVPQGSNSINFTFDYCPLNPPDSSTIPTSTDLTMTRAILYCGAGPEDMMPAGNQTIGYASTIAKVTSNSSNFDNVSKIDLTNDTIDVTVSSGQIPVGACLKLTINSGTITGLTTATYYYVISSVAVGTGISRIKLSTSPDGTAIDITASTAGNSKFSWATYGGQIYSLPKCLNRIPCCGIWNTGGNIIYPKAIPGRGVGITQLVPSVEPSSASTTPANISACIFTSTSLSLSARRELPYPVFEATINAQYYQDVTLLSNFGVNFYIPIKDQANNKITWAFESRQYAQRLWVVNNFNEPFYTNGYVLKAGIPSDEATNQFARWPITKFIEFYKDRMMLASDKSNDSYQAQYFYFSKLDTGVGDIQDFSFNDTTPNALPVNTGDNSIIQGLNIYSQDLTSIGAESFFVIGKQLSVFTWSGDVTTAAKQVAKAAGFAGPTCYAISKFGPVYVGPDNVYFFKTSEEVIPIGDGVKDIIQSLSEQSLFNIVTVFHDQDIKIAYQDQSNLDKELWLRFKYMNGGINKYWSGPHEMQEMQGEAVIPFFDSQRNVRLSFLDTDIFQRDDPGSFLNNGQDIRRNITIRNLGLNADHLWKIITRVFLHLKIVQDESFDLTFESEDGSVSDVFSATVTFNGKNKTLKQIVLPPPRFMARVLRLSIENSSNADLSLYDLSVLYNVMRRRKLSV